MSLRAAKSLTALLVALSVVALSMASCSSGPDKQNGTSDGSGQPGPGDGEKPADTAEKPVDTAGQDDAEPPLDPEKVGDFRMPHLVGLTTVHAAILANEAGLGRMEVAFREEGEDPVPKVASQTPESGAWAARGQGFKLVVVVKAQGRIKVPDAAGKTLEEAKTLLSAASFTIGLVFYKPAGADKDNDNGAGDGSEKPAGEGTPPADGAGEKPPAEETPKPADGDAGKPAPKAPIVSSQSPEAGSEAYPGTHVDLVLAIPEGLDFKAIVPELAGKTRIAALHLLYSSGLKPGRTTYAVSEAAGGTIASQMPSAGSEVLPGTEVVIDIACGNIEVEAPSVAGRTIAEAAAELARFDLKIGKLTPVRGKPDQMNRITSQSPLPGEPVRIGGFVDVTAVLAEAKAPMAAAGGSASAKEGEDFTLDGSGSKAFGGRSIVKYAWSRKGSEPQVSAEPRLAVKGLPAGEYEFDLVVEDSLGLMSAPSTVKVVVSKAEVAVPDVSGLDSAEAAKALEAAGLVTGGTVEEESAAEAGRVTRTDPAAGTQVAQGSAVKIFVSAKKADIVPPQDDTVAVPNLKGMTLDRAKAEIESAGLAVGGVEETETEEQEKDGTVSGQAPEAGMKIEKGTAVAIMVFRKKAAVEQPAGDVEVPDVGGMKIEAAKEALEKAGLKAGRITMKPGQGVPGSVISQTPFASAKVPRGSVVDLDVGGDKPQVAVPAVKGKGREKAVAEIEAAGLRCSIVRKEEEGEDDVVISVNPAEGSMVEPGSKVEIEVRKALKPKDEGVMVPELVGLTPEAAKERLANVGLKVGAVEEKEEAGGDGTISWQTPPCNTKVKAGFAVSFRVRKAPSAPDVAVPNVVGLALVDAGKALEKAGLKVGLTPFENTNDFSPGTVLRQDPAAGKTVKPGSAVRLVIAQKGAVMVRVPDLKGKTEADARAEIVKAGLIAGEVTRGVPSGNEPVGTVIDQTPMYGREVEAGSKVHFVLAVKPPEKVKVPAVTGKPLAEAQTEIGKAGLKVGSVNVEEKSGAPKDQVVAQSVDPGTEVKPGTVVNLIVSKGLVDKVKTPLLLRKTLKEAEEILKAAGLEIGTVTQTTKYGKEIIVRQDPPPFKEVARGSKIDVEVTSNK